MRICLVYDCLFPHTVGGAERWYRGLAEGLVETGHDVTYLTLRQWERGASPDVPGVAVKAVGPRMTLYVKGRRRILPPLVFGAGVFLHLLAHGRRYDVVHTCSFPYFSLLAAATCRRLHRFRLAVDWFEIWTRGYWRSYVGRTRGLVGWRVQRLCARSAHRAFCFSRLHASRLREEGHQGEITILEGAYAGPLTADDPVQADPVIVFAGRHIPEKGIRELIPAFQRARELIPALRMEVYGDGPERQAFLRDRDAAGLADVVIAPGFVESDVLAEALRRALCLVHPSVREGYGLVVLEAASHGTPSVLVQAPDNAATELVEEGVNGFVAPSASADDLAGAVVAIQQAGQTMRQSTAAWFAHNASRLSFDTSLSKVLDGYGGARR